MASVLTLIAKPLTDDHVRTACAAAGTTAAPDWLADAEACDLRVADGTDHAARVRAALDGEPVDLLQQPETPSRRRRLLLADMDSTIITVECIDEMADVLGLKPQIAAITERAMRGELDFAAALRERAGMLAGLPREALEQVYAERIRLTPGARTLVMTMRANGAYTALVSGGFRFFTGRVRAAAGFDHDRANDLVWANDRLTGTVQEPILGAQAKLAALRELTQGRQLRPMETMAVGDGANDLPMLQAAGLGVAYHAKPMVARDAAARIDHNDLTALLYLQGYRREDFRDDA